MRNVIQEATVRQMHLKQGITEIHVDPDTFVTQQAKEYIREKRLVLIENQIKDAVDYKMVNLDIHSPQGCNQIEEKPEHMTHIHGNVLVSKKHKVIALRGKIDTLESMIIQVQWEADKSGYPCIVRDLGEILDYCRQMLRCEVTQKPLPETCLLGFSSTELRAISHNPQKYYGIDHILPNYQMGKLGIQFNFLRTKAREVELVAIEAFVNEENHMERKDILEGMNRLSSVFYILMCRFVAGKYEKIEG